MTETITQISPIDSGHYILRPNQSLL
jgi:hypothetical protein